MIEWIDMESLVWPWNGTTWYLVDEKPSEVAAARGVVIPGGWTPSPRRSRFAALLEGARLEDVIKTAKRAENVITSPRGPVVIGFEEEALSVTFADRPGVTVYRVITFLDTGKFSCDIWGLDGDARYDVPWVGGSNSEIPVVADVDGETDPRAIVRRLGLPEDYLFPS